MKRLLCLISISLGLTSFASADGIPICPIVANVPIIQFFSYTVLSRYVATINYPCYFVDDNFRIVPTYPDTSMTSIESAVVWNPVIHKVTRSNMIVEFMNYYPQYYPNLITVRYMLIHPAYTDSQVRELKLRHIIQ